MSLMSTELTNIGPLCQAAVVTFQPFTMSFQLLGISVAFFALVKVFASVAKAYLSLHSLPKAQQRNRKIHSLTTKYNLQPNTITIIDDARLLAFTSIMPCISNGIFISKGACTQLSQKQLEAVFVHELHHWQQKDPLKQVLLKIATEVLFFLPSIKDLHSHWQLQAELHADSAVLKHLGSSVSLKNALAKWLRSTDLNTQVPLWAVAFAETQLGARLSRLNKKQASQSSPWSALRLQVLARLAVTFSILGALFVSQTSTLAQAKAQLVIPTSPQCSQIWNANSQQSSVFSAMSHQ